LIKTIKGNFIFTSFWFKYSAGAGIVASFITAGSSFGIVSVRVAFSWTVAFAEAGGAMIGQVSRDFERVGSAITSGVGQISMGSIGQVSQTMRGAAGIFGKP
jgi:hypothetical protein